MGVLQYLLDSKHKLKLQNIKLRFQMLTAVQCWWHFIDVQRSAASGSSLASWRRVHQTLAAVSAALPGPEESIGEQEVISTTDHAEVARALPAEVQPRARMEDFAFPFWLDGEGPRPKSVEERAGQDDHGDARSDVANGNTRAAKYSDSVTLDLQTNAAAMQSDDFDAPHLEA